MTEHFIACLVLWIGCCLCAALGEAFRQSGDAWARVDGKCWDDGDSIARRIGFFGILAFVAFVGWNTSAFGLLGFYAFSFGASYCLGEQIAYGMHFGRSSYTNREVEGHAGYLRRLLEALRFLVSPFIVVLVVCLALGMVWGVSTFLFTFFPLPADWSLQPLVQTVKDFWQVPMVQLWLFYAFLAYTASTAGTVAVIMGKADKLENAWQAKEKYRREIDEYLRSEAIERGERGHGYYGNDIP